MKYQHDIDGFHFIFPDNIINIIMIKLINNK